MANRISEFYVVSWKDNAIIGSYGDINSAKKECRKIGYGYLWGVYGPLTYVAIKESDELLLHYNMRRDPNPPLS